jgi:LuxR family transcriptional regulator, maltose regulon positive regulatory protein
MAHLVAAGAKRSSSAQVRPGRPPLLPAKLAAPPAQGTRVDRVRLRGLLDQWPHHPVTLVCAPAGYGKTTLAAAWAATQPAGTTAWLSLDRGDRDPRRFWSYVLAALRPTGALPDPPPADRPPADLLGTLAALRWPVALVLDDADAVAGTAVARSLARCLHYRTPLHLVLCSRSQPPLPTGRLLAAGELAVLDRAELAFTAPEIVELAALHGVALTREQAAVLGRRSDGWVTGLILALAGARDFDGVAGQLVGDTGPIADYLREEVLARQPAGVRRWLLRTSVLHRVAPQCADAVTGHAEALPTLSRLRSQNVFLSQDPADAATVRHHPLFRELLAYEAATQLGAELPALHRGAARWLSGNGDPVSAVEHAAAVPDWRYVATLTVRYAAPHLSSAPGDRLRCVLGALSRARPHPNDPETIAALALLGPGAPGPEGWAESGPVAAAGALADVMAVDRDGDLSDLAGAADRLLAVCARPDGLSWDRGGYAALARCSRALAQLWCGPPESAAEDLAAAAVATDRAGLTAASARLAGERALFLAFCGRLREAEQAAVEAGRYAYTVGVPRSGPALLGLWLVRWLRGGPEHEDGYLAGVRGPSEAAPGGLAAALVRARSGTAPGPVGVAAALRRLGGRPVPPLLRPWLAADEARELLGAGACEAALDALAGYLDVPVTLATAPARVVAARAHLATGGYRRATTLLEPVRSAPSDVDSQVSAGLLVALAADALGREGAVRITLAETLALAARERLVRPLRSAGPAVSALLRRHGDLVAAKPALAGRLEVVGEKDGGGPARPGLLEPVTEREGVVLRYLPTMLTTEDIAAELCVSRNTVKSQIRSIYRKLGVARRRDAVQRARALRLI